MKFDYIALLPNGERDSGVIDASSRNAALQRLSVEGKTPLKLKQSTDGQLMAMLTGKQSATFTSPGNEKLAQFLRDLSILMQAGAPILTALRMIRDAGPDARIGNLVKAMIVELENGATIAQAIPASADADIRVVAGLIAAGERSGHLSETLDLGAELFEARDERQKKIVSALAYPIFVMLLGIASLIIMAFVVAPVLEPLLDQANDDGLANLINASNFISANWTFIMIGLVAIFIISAMALSRDYIRYRVSALLVRLPLIGRVIRHLNYGVALQCLGTLLKGGAPVRDALTLSSDIVTSPFIQRQLLQGLDRVSEGDRMSQVLGDLYGAPTEIAQMVTVGEASGALGITLGHTGKILTNRASRLLMAGISVIGPTMIIVFGMTSGLLMLTVMGAMTNIGAGVLE